MKSGKREIVSAERQALLVREQGAGCPVLFAFCWRKGGVRGKPQFTA